MASENISELTHKALLKVRQKLLDLSKRNRLLNFKETARSIRIIDELPDQVFRIIVTDTKSMALLYDDSNIVEKPSKLSQEEFVLKTIKELRPSYSNGIHSIYSGFDEKFRNYFDGEAPSRILFKLEEEGLISIKKVKTGLILSLTGKKLNKVTTSSNEQKPLDPNRHNDLDLQTPYTATILERRCGRLSQDAKTAIEETGSNFLFLNIGYLEWYEDDESEISYKAPLILIPVQLERGKIDRENNCYTYKLSYTDEDIETNLSLALKLDKDGIELPGLDDQVAPSKYLDEVSRRIKHKKRWRVIPDMIVGMFSFAKILMYKDLDPEKWPSGFLSIIEHEKIQEILRVKETFTGTDGVIYDNEHDIDGNKDAVNIPLILDADSSQHSAIMDSLSNKDIVIEGPPGTGKSQTITNLIAAALYEGKSVLFVAEKKAALEVVRRRLDQAGLGDFCLELHSTKTQKGKLREDIKNRIGRHFKKPGELRYIVDDLARQRDKLREHMNAICKVVGPSEEKVYEIIWKAERWRTELPENQKTFIPIKNASDLTRNNIKDRITVLTDFVSLLKEIPQSAVKTFNGFNPFNIYPGDEHSLKTLLSDLIEDTKDLTIFLDDVVSEHNFPYGQTLGEVISIAEIDVDSISTIPDNFEQAILAKLVDSQAVEAVYELSEKINGYNNLLESINRYLRCNESLTLGHVLELKNIIESIKSLGYGEHSFDHLNSLIDNSEKAIKLLLELKNISAATSGILIEEINNIKHFQTLLSLCRLLLNSPADIDVNRHIAHLSPAATHIFRKAKDEATAVKDKINESSIFFHISRLPNYQDLRLIASDLDQHSLSFFSFFSRSLRKVRRIISSFVLDKANVKDPNMVSKLYEMADLLEKSGSILNNVEYQQVLGLLFKGTDTEWERLETHILWSQSLREMVGSQTFAEKIINNFGHCRDLSSKLLPKTKDIIKEVSGILEMLIVGDNPDISIDNALKRNQELIEHLRSAIDTLTPYIANESCTISDIVTTFDSYIDAIHTRERIEDNKHFKECLGCFFNGVDTDIKKLSALADWSTQLRNKGHIPDLIAEWTLLDTTPLRINMLADCVAKIERYLASHANALEGIMKIGNIEEEVFFGQAIKSAKITWIAKKYDDCIKQIDYLLLWKDYCEAKERAVQLGLSEFIKAIENGSVALEKSIATLNYSIYNSMVREIVRNSRVLSSFTSSSYENLRSSFIELDRKVMIIFREEIASNISQRFVPKGNGSGPVSTYTDMSLILHELNKRRRHIPTRQLIKRSGVALMSLKPCVMMSPLSVAQFLEPGKIVFDLVVMDEASQIRPADALGAFARANRVVVVGDSNQLPPSTFFDRINENYDDDETMAIEDTESILDISREIYPSRRLRWHYRSEHESLINFSNREFYDDDLIVFPSPIRSDKQFGIRCHYVKNAAYSKGRNLPEAQSIVNATIKHFEDAPEVSLGIATFNREQRDLIEDLLDKKRKNDVWLDNIIKKSEGKEEPFFIKNLENVQGDERDVIFISFTYGPDQDARKVYQRFGPIAHESGWRRLNVIFTRAKKRVEVFTSMLPTDIIITDSTPRGVRVLRGYLDYALNGRFHDVGEISKKEADSDFEIAVARVLNSSGYKTGYQVGVAGYFIDIGIVHPQRENDFILGVECDGVAYHSGKSVRDRDRLIKARNIRT